MINKQFMEITNKKKIIDGKVYVLCKCFCGDEKWFSERLIKAKGVNSCGCLGTVPYSTELTDEFLVSTEPQIAKLLLEFTPNNPVKLPNNLTFSGLVIYSL